MIKMDVAATRHPINELRRDALYLILFLFLVANIISAISRLTGNALQTNTNFFFAPFFIVVALVLFWFAARPQYALGVRIVISFFIPIYLYVYPDASATFLPLIIATVFIAAILLKGWFYWAAQLVILVRLLIHGGYIASLTEDGLTTSQASTMFINAALINIVFPLAMGLIIFYFLSRLEAKIDTEQRYSLLLEASANIGQNMAQNLELSELLSRSVDIIRDSFSYYHVQIFLLDDDNQYAYLNASTGEIGQQMLARQHRVQVDSNSVIGRVTRANEPIIARATDSGHAFNKLLPDTRAELGIPLSDNQGTIGALDLQSRDTNSFVESDIRVLQVIANQLATAIRNNRLFESQARNVQENKRLFIESETNLREIQRLNRQLTRQAWQDYLQAERRVDGVVLSPDGFHNRAVWTDSMLEARQRRRPIRTEDGDKQLVAVPIELRGEVLGAIEIEMTSQQEYDDMVDMLQAISQRLAVSLDNARLFEETNEATAQEQRIGELVSRYQTADTVDELLRITLTGLTETLGADNATIRLGTIPEGLDIESGSSTASQNGDADQ